MADSAPAISWSEVSTGTAHTCGIRVNGSLWCWGSNDHAQLGVGDNADHLVPTQVGRASSWEHISIGALHSCAIRTNDALYCWGSNISGQLGLGDLIVRLKPTQVSRHTTWSNIVGGSRHTCGIQTTAASGAGVSTTTDSSGWATSSSA